MGSGIPSRENEDIVEEIVDMTDGNRGRRG